ncbi:MAG: DUF6125 family protein [Promethearchaeota archaeon]
MIKAVIKIVENKKKLVLKNEGESAKEYLLELSKKDLKELLIKSHMTHDGMWFYHCQKKLGIKVTNKLNRAAIKSFAPIEIKRILDVFGLQKIDNIESLKTLINAAFIVFKAEFMKVYHSFPNDSCLRVEVKECWAFNGIKRMGIIEEYECGVFDRIDGWFNALGLKYDCKPVVNGCMMHEQGRCYRNYIFIFP